MLLDFDVDKAFNFFIKKLSVVEYVELVIQNTTTPWTNDPLVLQGWLEGVFYATQVSNLQHNRYNCQIIGSPLQSSYLREKEKKGKNFHNVFMGNLSCGHFTLICRHLVCSFSYKNFIIISMSANIYRPYVCDILGLYIALSNYSIEPITPYWSTSINYLHQHID